MNRLLDFTRRKGLEIMQREPQEQKPVDVAGTLQTIYNPGLSTTAPEAQPVTPPAPETITPIMSGLVGSKIKRRGNKFSLIDGTFIGGTSGII
jgi:hypothetical protein